MNQYKRTEIDPLNAPTSAGGRGGGPGGPGGPGASAEGAEEAKEFDIQRQNGGEAQSSPGIW